MTDYNKPDVSAYRPRFAQLTTMMKLPFQENPAGLDIAFSGVPYDMGTFVRPGARQGPAQIREMSRFIRLVNPATGVAPFELCQVADIGDAPVNPMNIEGTHDRIVAFYAEVARAGVAPLTVGGDHTIPLLIFRGLRDGGTLPADLGLVHVDAHADVLKMGEGFDGREVNHGAFVRLAVDEGLINPKRTIQLGLRGSQYSATANDFLPDHGGRQIYQHEFDRIGVEGVIKEVRRVVGKGPVYFTIDVDGLDPTACPGTGYPEPGGITVREMQAIMRACRGMDFIGGDICEVSPPHDPSGMTALTAAHLLFEMLCLVAESVARRKGRLT